MKKATINLYEINELCKEARAIAIKERKQFLLKTFNPNECHMTRSKYEKALTNEEVIHSIEANEFLYFSNGDMATTIKYVEKHPKAGEEVLLFGGEDGGEEYQIENI